MSDTQPNPESPKTDTAQPSANGHKKAPASFRSVLGVKKGMTQMFDKEGRLLAVTEVEAGPCTVLSVRTQERDHYTAVQLGFGPIAERKVSKPQMGQFKKAGAAPARFIREVRVKDTKGFEIGQVVSVDGMFTPMDYVDVQSTSKGRGFAGVMKRHGFHGMPGSHGASDKERSPGSLTARRALGRVLPGQRMAGHKGDVTYTSMKIEVIGVDPAKNMIYLNGSVAGAKGSYVLVSETVKNKKKRVIVKRDTVLRDKMGNIIVAKGAKAAAKAAKPAAPAAGAAPKK